MWFIENKLLRFLAVIAVTAVGSALFVFIAIVHPDNLVSALGALLVVWYFLYFSWKKFSTKKH
ncbi:MAG: hypothetical protein BMS9Abin13_381 [Patescibacteria group bacterium]|nr:MAG: hypothetical protein BMS9Abin13_381 [Patescibacteria group bacterium]